MSLILSVPTHSLISPKAQPARGINELSIIVESARSAHFQHRIKIDSICKEEIKKSTQNEIEMQDKCKFSQRGRELGTRIASVETAACVRLVANQHPAPGTKHQAPSTEQRAKSDEHPAQVIADEPERTDCSSAQGWSASVCSELQIAVVSFRRLWSVCASGDRAYLDDWRGLVRLQLQLRLGR